MRNGKGEEKEIPEKIAKRKSKWKQNVEILQKARTYLDKTPLKGVLCKCFSPNSIAFN